MSFSNGLSQTQPDDAHVFHTPMVFATAQRPYAAWIPPSFSAFPRISCFPQDTIDSLSSFLCSFAVHFPLLFKMTHSRFLGACRIHAHMATFSPFRIFQVLQFTPVFRKWMTDKCRQVQILELLEAKTMGKSNLG